MTTTISVRLEEDGKDEELVDRLESEPVKSDAVRAALRDRYDLGTQHDLSEALANVYDALLTITDGGGRIPLSVAKKSVPQFVTHYDSTTVVDAAFRPLQAAGYVEPIQRIDTVVLYVRPEGVVHEDPDPADADLDESGRAEAILDDDYEIEGGEPA